MTHTARGWGPRGTAPAHTCEMVPGKTTVLYHLSAEDRSRNGVLVASHEEARCRASCPIPHR